MQIAIGKIGGGVMEDSGSHSFAVQSLAASCIFTEFTQALLLEAPVLSAVACIQAYDYLNTNVILYLLWFSLSSGGRLPVKALSMLDREVALWRQRVTVELKYTHAMLKGAHTPMADELRAELQDEIAKAHLIEQQMLYDAGLKLARFSPKRSPTRCMQDTVINWAAYVTSHELTCDQNLVVALAQLLQTVFQSQVDASVLAESQDKLAKTLQAEGLKQVSWL